MIALGIISLPIVHMRVSGGKGTSLAFFLFSFFSGSLIAQSHQEEGEREGEAVYLLAPGLDVTPAIGDRSSLWTGRDKGIANRGLFQGFCSCWTTRTTALHCRRRHASVSLRRVRWSVRDSRRPSRFSRRTHI